MSEKVVVDEQLPIIARFEVRRRSYFVLYGTVQGPLPSFSTEPSQLLPLYRGMVLTRTLDLKAVSLQRTGRLGTYAVSLGQEAVSVGIASAMRQEDVLLPSYRDPELSDHWGLVSEAMNVIYSFTHDHIAFCINAMNLKNRLG